MACPRIFIVSKNKRHDIRFLPNALFLLSSTTSSFPGPFNNITVFSGPGGWEPTLIGGLTVEGFDNPEGCVVHFSVLIEGLSTLKGALMIWLLNIPNLGRVHRFYIRVMCDLKSSVLAIPTFLH